MPLNLISIRPGYNKQITDTAAEGQYVDGDFVRFRSGLPEKIGGWERITTNTLCGVIRAQHQWTDLDGRVYACLASLRTLNIYYQGAFYDITPLEAAQTGATLYNKWIRYCYSKSNRPSITTRGFIYIHFCNSTNRSRIHNRKF